MKKWLKASLVWMLTYQSSYAQVNEKKDSIRGVKLAYSCLVRGQGFYHNNLEDSTLAEFFHQIDLNGFYEPLENGTIKFTTLLNKAECDSTEICLLPIFRILDPNANEVYTKNCKISPMAFQHTSYCQENQVRYALLLYLQFVIVDPIKVADNEIIKKIKLVKKVDNIISSEITDDDFKKIFKKYYYWLNMELDYQNFYKHPLTASYYYWEIEIELKDTGWYRKSNIYTPIKVE